jgi:hypothetical protein
MLCCLVHDPAKTAGTFSFTPILQQFSIDLIKDSLKEEIG